MAKTTTPAGTEASIAERLAPVQAAINEKSADATVANALAAMEAQIAQLTAENAALKAVPPDAQNEKFKAVDLEDPANMSMMERRGEVAVHPTTGEPIFNPLRSAVRPPA